MVKVLRVRRNFMFSILALAYFFVLFHRFSPAVIAPEIMSEFDVSATMLGLLAATYFYTYMFMQIPVGFFADNIGPRKTISFFMLLASVGALIFTLAENFNHLIFGRLLIGLGVSVVWVCTLKFVAAWYGLREFATMNGVLNFIGNIGAVFAATPLAFVVVAFGWRLSFLILSMITTLLAIATWLFVRDRPSQLNGQNKIFVGSLSFPEALKIVFLSKYFWLVAIPFFAWYGSFASFQGIWGIPYLMQIYNYSKIEASFSLTMAAIGFGFGATFWGLLSDKVLGVRKPIFILGYFAYTLTWLILVVWKVLPSMLCILFFMLGFFSGAIVISVPMLRETFPEKIVGVVLGCVNTLCFVGVGFFQPLIGYTLDLYGPIKIVEGVKIYSPQAYQAAFLLCFLALVIASVATIFTKETLRK